MNFDLDARSNRLEKEQLKRREDARKKRDKELILKANAQRLDEELRELNVKRKLEAEEFEIERQRLEDEERQLTGDINYKEILKPISIQGEDDKVILPESALEILSSQDFFGKGAAVFQLTLTMAGDLFKRHDYEHFNEEASTASMIKFDCYLVLHTSCLDNTLPSRYFLNRWYHYYNSLRSERIQCRPW